MNSFILYTYQTVDGQLECRAYGPTSSQQAQLLGERLAEAATAAGETELAYMVLPLQAMPS
jgi:hypothetical protein